MLLGFNTLLGVKLLASCSRERARLWAAVGARAPSALLGDGCNIPQGARSALAAELVPCCGAGSLHGPLKLAGDKEPNQNGSVGCFAAARLGPNT